MVPEDVEEILMAEFSQSRALQRLPVDLIASIYGIKIMGRVLIRIV